MFIKLHGILNRPDSLPERLLHRSILLAILLLLLCLFTKGFFYSIMALLGSAISLSGYIMTIRLTDRYLNMKKGIALYFFAGTGKVILIIAAFFLISRYDPRWIIPFLAGLSVVILAVMLEGGAIFLRGVFKRGT